MSRLSEAWAVLLAQPQARDGTGEAAAVAEKKRNPLFRWLKRPRLWWPAIAGGILILIAIAYDYGWWITQGSGVRTSSIFNHATPIHWISELGYAFIIAWIVSITIEEGARREHLQEVRADRQLVMQDVFQAVYGLRHDPVYIRSIIETVLEAKLVRDNYEVTYRIDPFPADEADARGIDATRFVLLTLRSRYRLRSVALSKIHFHVKFGIPIRGGGFAGIGKLTGIHIDDESWGEDRLSDLIVDVGDPNQLFHSIDTDLEPGGSKVIQIDGQMVKELSDSEMFGFLHPTMGMSLKLNVNVPGLKFGMRARTASPEKEVHKSDNRSGEWAIDGPIMPYNSVVLWWRSAEDDGQVSAAALPKAAEGGGEQKI